MNHSGRRIFANAQCSVPGSLLQAIDLVQLVLLTFLPMVASAEYETPASSMGTVVGLDQAGAPAQHSRGPEAYEETRHPVFRKSHVTILTLAVIVFAVLRIMAASKKATLLKVRLLAQWSSSLRLTRRLLVAQARLVLPHVWNSMNIHN